ncbi:FLYWCH zinc finger domain-containing protein [Phthorimaea operculella]|nr:FLYWCH zinc finger domain-containing protein [Phthorimaea operculella]
MSRQLQAEPPDQHMEPFVAVHWVQNTAGKELALISGHAFYKNSRNSWRCTRAKSCKARFLVDKQQNIKKANLVHNHDSNNYCIKNVKWVRNVSGRQVALVNGFPFNSRHSSKLYWWCTKRRTCRAHFTVDQHWNIVRSNFSHDHIPQPFIIKDGVYIKL